MVLPALCSKPIRGAARYPVTMTDIFDVIADPTRRQLLTALRDRLSAEGAGGSAIDIAEFVGLLGVTRPTVVKHLAVLQQAGLVVEAVDGTTRSYTLDASPLEELEDWLVPFIGVGEHGHAYTADAAADSVWDASAAFAAWSGADVGESIGRAVADRSYRARTAIQGATDKVARKLPRGRRTP